jgi:hypothetical protein
MTRHSLQRRLAALERARTPDDGAYVVDIGDGYVDWHGERIPIDEWQRCHPDAITVDIGGSTNDDENRVTRLGNDGEYEL